MSWLKSKFENIHQKHFAKHHHNPNSVKKIDRAMATIGIFGPIATSVQVFHIFSTKAVAGLSPISWAGYSIVSLAWVGYGFFYKDKPLVIVNTAGCIMSSLVFAGYMLFR